MYPPLLCSSSTLHVPLGGMVIFGLGFLTLYWVFLSVFMQAGCTLSLSCQAAAPADGYSFLISLFVLLVHLLAGRAWETKTALGLR